MSPALKMDCEYRGVPKEEIYEDHTELLSRTLFLRQLFVSSGAWTMFFICGLYLGSPTVIIPQLRKEANSTNAVSVEMSSWLSSISSYGALPWEIILPVLLFYLGRKITSIIIHIAIIVVSIVFYFSSTVIQLLIFELLQGIPYAGILTVSVVIIAEYTSPEYRGLFLTMKSASVCWGIWVSNAIGTFFPWRYISVVGFVCSLYTLTVLFWPESPFWLATKGRYDECRAAHRWLKGPGKVAENELKALIKIVPQNTKVKYFMRYFVTTLVSKDFYRPVLLSTLTIGLYHLSGRIVYTIYAIEIIKKITGTDSSAYVGMLILDGASVFSTYVGSILSKTVKRRTILLRSAVGMLIFLFTLSIYLYLVKLNVVSENNYLSISLLTGFSICVSVGPASLAVALYGELIPLKHKSLAVVFVSLVFSSLQSTLIKLAPYTFRLFNIHGAFLLYAICSSIVTLLIYKYLPETKDRTLHEIEDMFKDQPDDEESGKKMNN